MEDRLVPTVMYHYNPLFGVETQADGNGDVLRSPTVHFIFWGSWWASHQDQAQSLQAAAGKIIDSGYLARLDQYGSDGFAVLGNRAFDFSDPASGHFGPGGINDCVNGQLDASALPRDDNAIYVVVTSPGVVSDDPNAGGFNDKEDYPEVWVSTSFLPAGGKVKANTVANTDRFTTYLSHEIAECMSSLDGDGFMVHPGANFKTDLPHTGQIGDYEGNNYLFREPNGVQVQPYWSDDDKAWITPDGFSQNLNLNPIWNGTKFTGTYALDIQGDELLPLPGLADHITIDAQGGIRVNLNGWQTQFDPGRIASVHVSAGVHDAWIDVEGTAGVPLTIDLGTGQDTVNITPTAKNLDRIGGTVQVNGGKGPSTLNVDDGATKASEVYLLGAGSVQRSPITVQGPPTTIAYAGIDTLNLDGGIGPEMLFNVSGTQGAAETTIVCGVAPSTVNVMDTTGVLNVAGSPTVGKVNVMDQHSVQGIHGAVNVTATATLNVDDSADLKGHNVTLTAEAITGLAPADITYDENSLVALNVETSRGVNQMHILSTPKPWLGVGSVPTTVTNHGHDTITVGQAHSLQNIRSDLKLVTTGFAPAVTLDDSADTVAGVVTITNSAVTGLAPATIRYTKDRVATLNIEAGSGGSTFDVLSTPNTGRPGSFTTNLSSRGDDTVNVGDAGSVQGIAGKLNLSDPADDRYEQVTVDASADTHGRNVLLTGAALTGLAPADISYAQDGLSGLDLATGSGVDVINVQGTPSSYYQPGVLTTLHCKGNDAVTVGSATGGVQGVREGLKIIGTGGSVALTVSDAGDKGNRTAHLDAHTLTGLAPGKIDWTSAVLSSLIVVGGNGGTTWTVADTPAQSTTIYSEAVGGAVDQVDVLQTHGPLAVYTLSGYDKVTLGSPGGALAGANGPGLLGMVSVGASGPGAAALIVNDSGDTSYRDITVTRDALTGLTPAPISLSHLASLTINGDSGGSRLTLGSPVPTFPLTFHGGAGANSLAAPNVPNVTNVWSISATDGGTLTGVASSAILPKEQVTFSAVQTLIGTGADDTFRLAPGGKVSGTIDGGGGRNWLDYSARNTPVTVNLATGSATSVAGGISYIRHVLGSQGDNQLTGDGQGNILVGGAGTNVLTAGSGRSLLIGGEGTTTLVGGTGDDILIAGSTAYDLNEAALMAILKEWQRTDRNFQQRKADLVGGGGYNGNFKLNHLTVSDNDVAGADVTGGGGDDWIIAVGDDIVH
jgi:hypothetical protein